MLMSPCFRTSLDTVAVLDSRDCALVPAHDLLLSATHSLAYNHRGQLSSLVSSCDHAHDVILGVEIFCGYEWHKNEFFLKLKEN